MKPGRALPYLVLAYFVVVVCANAYLWSGDLGLRALEYRRFDYEWELQLPWRAGRGEWAAFDFYYPVGPLWQLIAWLPSIGHTSEASRVVAMMHLAFPLLSLAVAALVVFVTLSEPRRRALALFGLGLLALHDDVRSLRAVVVLAAVVAYVPLLAPGVVPGFDPREPKSHLRPGLAGLAFVLASLLSLDNFLLGLAGFAAMVIFEAVAVRRVRAAALRGASFGLAAALGLGIFAGLLEWRGHGVAAFVHGSVGLVRDYTLAQVDDPAGFTVHNAVLFVLLALLPALAFAGKRHLDVTHGMWLAGVAPSVFRGVLRSDPEHVYAALMPLAGVLVLVCARSVGRRNAVTAWSGLLASTFVLGWFGAHVDRPSAWQPTKLWRAARRLASTPPPATGYQGDLGRVVAWMKDRATDARCIGVPHGLGAAHAITNVDGPTKNVLRWSVSRQRSLARAIEQSACPLAVERLNTFDWPKGLHEWALGPDFLVRAELYRPVARLGPAVFGAELRAEPARPGRRPLPLSEAPAAAVLEVPGSVDYSFSRPVPYEHLLEVEYELSVSSVRRLAGGMPWLEVQFFAGNDPLGEPMIFNGLEVDRRVTQVVGIAPEVAEWRWIAGQRPAENRAATRMMIRTVPRDASPASVVFQLYGLAELSPPDTPAFDAPTACRKDVSLVEEVAAGRALGRFTTAHVTDDSIALAPNQYPEPPSELFVPITPCDGSCLFAQVGILGGQGDGASFEVHAVDGAVRPRLAKFELRPNTPDELIEAPLSRFAGRPILLRLASESGATTTGDDVRIRKARVGPCTSRRSLVFALHQGQYRDVRGTSAVRVDQMVLTTLEPAAPPADTRIGLQPRAGECLALDLAPERIDEKSGGVALEVSVVESDVVRRLAREEFASADSPLRSLRNLPLGQWQGKWVELRLATWPLELAGPSRALFIRPRLHRCGQDAAWGFH